MAKDPRLAKITDDYIKALQQTGAGRTNAQKLLTATAPITQFGPMTVDHPDERNPGIGSRLLDIISRPLYGVANVLKETEKSLAKIGHDTGLKASQKDASGQDFQAGMDPFSALWRGVSGQDKTTFRDVISQSETDTSKVNPIVKGVGGLALDVALDPSNLLVGPVVAKVAGKLGKGAKAVEEAPVTSVTGLETRPKVTGFETPKNEGAPAVQLSGAPAPASQLPDAVDRALATPPESLPINNTPRPVGAPKVVDSTAQAAIVRLHVGEASQNVNKLQQKLPTFINEIDPEQYSLAKQIVASTYAGPDMSFISASHLTDLAKKSGITMGYREATRYITLMRKEGVISDALKGGNKTAGRNPSHKILDPAGVGNPDALKVWTPEAKAQRMDEVVGASLRAHFDDLASKGILPEIKAADGSKYTMSTADVLESIPQQARLDLQYAPAGHPNLYPSQWNAGAAEALRLDAMGVSGVDAIPQIQAAMKSATAPGALRAGLIESSGNLTRAAETLHDNVGSLYDRLLENTKKFDQKDLIDADALAKTKAQNLMDSLENGPTSGAINQVASVGSDVQKMAREAGATDNAAIHAIHSVAPVVAKVATEADTATAQATKAVARNNRVLTPTVAAAKNQQRIARLGTVLDQSAEDLAKQLGIPTVTLGEKYDFQIQNRLDKFLNPVRARFKFGAGSGDFASLMRKGDGVAENWALKYRAFLATVDKTHAPTDIQGAWSALKRGILPTDPKTLAAYNDVEKALDHIFDTNDGLLGRLFRNGVTVEELNKHLKKFFVSHRFEKVAGGKEVSMTDLADQWRDWDIKDPLAEFEKINAAIQHVEAKQAVGGVFSKQFGSTVPKPGYVRISANELSAMGAFVDRGLFYPKEAAEQMKRLDELARAETSFQGNKGGVAAFVNHVLDPAMRMWKPSVTIIRPGHHIRNLISDITLGSWDGVTSIRHYTAAKNMMSAGGAIKKEGIEGIDSLFNGALRTGDKKMLTVKLKGGRQADLSVDGGYQLASRQGILMSHFNTEDFMEQGGKILDAVMNTAPLRAAGKVSELNGHFTRLAHFHKLMEDAKFTRQFNTLDDAAFAAAERVRKFHPDVKGLTPFETKYMRRVIPFYSWFRQAAPVVMSTMLTKPGRVADIPKAQYNLAVAMGQDPESLSNPFPTDKLYPSFITDNLTGPVFGSVGMNTGTPTEGVLGDTLNGNVPRNILGMLNPVLKAPVDLISGTNMATGANIPDKGEYIDQLLPFLNQAAAISGYSPTGSVAGLTIDPQRAVVKGEKDHLWNLQLANFLTGLGLNETEKPSFSVIAGKEKNQ